MQMNADSHRAPGAEWLIPNAAYLGAIQATIGFTNAHFNTSFKPYHQG